MPGKLPKKLLKKMTKAEVKAHNVRVKEIKKLANRIDTLFKRGMKVAKKVEKRK